MPLKVEARVDEVLFGLYQSIVTRRPNRSAVQHCRRHWHVCEGVSITQRNNSAVLGFAQPYSNGWRKYLNSRKKLSNLIFIKFSPSIGGVKVYLVLNFEDIWPPIFGKRGSKFKISPYISENGGNWGSKISSSDREPRGLLIEP